MISARVLMSISLCIGTTRVVFPEGVCLFIKTWLSFCLLVTKPVLERALITFWPDSLGSFANWFHLEINYDCIF